MFFEKKEVNQILYISFILSKILYNASYFASDDGMLLRRISRDCCPSVSSRRASETRVSQSLCGRKGSHPSSRERERHFSESECVKAIKQESKKISNLVKSWNSD